MRGMDKSRGRPKKPEAELKSVILRVCLSPTENQTVESKAQSEHMDKSVWARTVILRAAEKK